jgi:sugar lactone lactonase YvrE
MRLRNLGLLAALALALSTSVAAAAPAFPATLPLPAAFQPEGIAIRGNTFYVGSIPTGAIYRGNVRTGQGAVFIQGGSGRAAIGLEIDNRNRLFVAGGPTGDGYVYNVRTRELIRSYELTTSSTTFINDVVVTRTGAYFTDSRQARLYRIAIGRGGRLSTSVQTIPLAPPFQLQGQFNANGIDATANGRWLVIVQSSTGKLYRVSPATGATREIALGGATVPNGDGILLDGRTLYVVQNQLNKIAVIRVNAALTSGTIRSTITDSRFDVPTTIDDHGRRLYAVNAHFGDPPSSTPYQVLQLRKPPGS